MHAGPATNDGRERIVLFLTFSDSEGVTYDMNEQFGPTTTANLFNSAELILRKSVEYEDYNPVTFMNEGR